MLLWRCCYGLFLLLSVFLFSPWVIPKGQYLPMLYGVPYTLWLGFFIAIGFVLLTLLAGFCQPNKDNEC